MGKIKLTITPMRYGDISQVMELERNILSAWSEEHLKDEIEQPSGFQLIVRRKETGNMLAVLCGRIMADEAEILKLSVAEHVRRMKIGYALLDFAMRYCRKKGVKKCFLELRASNAAARKLYEKRGFRIVNTRRDYYEDPTEDAIIMQLKLA